MSSPCKGMRYNKPRRDIAEALAAKHGVSVRVVRKHIKLFTGPIQEDALATIVNDLKRSKPRSKPCP